MACDSAAWEAAYMTTGGESPLNERKDRMEKTCGWCDGYGVYDIETRRVCRHCHGTGFEPEDQAVLLVTANTKRANTKRETAYSSIFVRLNENGTKLNDTEKRVLEMIRQDLDVWSCGCVTGIPETMFGASEFRNLHKHGIGKRFEGNGSWWGNEQNTPESIQESERGEKMWQNIDDDLEHAFSALEVIKVEEYLYDVAQR